jgi:SEC-C motif
MTLLVTLAAPWAIHQSSDYRLTLLNPSQGPPPNDVAGSKQFTISSQGLVAQLCFTGVAQIGRFKTREWISQIIADTPQPIVISQLALEIAVRGSTAVSAMPPGHRMLTVIIAVVEHGQIPRLVMVSNVDRLNGPRRERTLDKLEVSSMTAARPMVHSFGCDIGLSRSNKKYLLNLLRHTQDAKNIKEALAAVNKSVAQNPKSQGSISEGCMVSTLLADGSTSRINFGEVAGIPDDFMGNTNIGEFLRKNLQVAPGKQITLVQSASAFRTGNEGYTQLLPEGEPRTLHFSTPTSVMPDAAKSFGADFDKLVLTGNSGTVMIRKNEPVTVTLNTVTWEVARSAEYPGEIRMFPAFKITNLPTIEGVQPRTWDYGFDVSTQHQNARTLTIRTNSVAFRSANFERPLPLLGPTEELVMAAPKGGLKLSVAATERSATGTIEAEFLLRGFPELGPPTSGAITISLPKGSSEQPTAPAGFSRKVGRNAPCPCGSGEKFKKCHG